MGIALEQGMDSSPTSPVASLPLDGSVVKMKGLPFKAGNEDVLRFYVGFSIKAHSIYLKRHPDGRPSGEVRFNVSCKFISIQYGWLRGFGEAPAGRIRLLWQLRAWSASAQQARG